MREISFPTLLEVAVLRFASYPSLESINRPGFAARLYAGTLLQLGLRVSRSQRSFSAGSNSIQRSISLITFEGI